MCTKGRDVINADESEVAGAPRARRHRLAPVTISRQSPWQLSPLSPRRVRSGSSARPCFQGVRLYLKHWETGSPIPTAI